MIISIDNWHGVYSNEESFDLTNPDTLLRCINDLNGKNKTSVALTHDEEIYMVIGGGNEGKYSVVGGINGQIYNLINKNNINKKGYVQIVTGGQLGDFEMKYCVDKEMAIQAANHFYKNIDFDKTLKWEIL
ncbi:hypothetical protein [Xylocopilactobacillus apicola]|nr:hypothetical protein [Xylocopilactobacillus apicola]